jgi:processive 1,2-diacylglycerol beta-glucosyltransferase
MRAAEAVELALRQIVPSAAVKNVDVLTLTNAVFRRVYAKSYLELVNRSPHVLGYVYDLMDQPSRSGKHRSDRLRLAVEKLNLRAFIRFLESEPQNLIINTHFLPAEIIASLRKNEQLHIPQVTVTTDFETHRLWVNQPCEHYFTATDEGARYLSHWGVPAEDITTTGIPIHPVFCEAKDRRSCLAKHGLLGERPVILQMAGGFGVGPIEKLYRALLDVDVPLEILLVSGRNETVKAQLDAVPVPPRHHAKVLGFSKDIDELMVCADLVMSKPGGLTTSEALARGAGMVIVNPTPGQEYRNSDFLLENGAAIKVNNIGTLAHKISQFLRDPGRLDQLKSNARRLARPNAALEVARHALALLDTSRHSDVTAEPETR